MIGINSTVGLMEKNLPKDVAVKEGEMKSFDDILKESLQKVNTNLLKSEKLTGEFALGKDVELHQVVLAGEQASLALQLTIQIRTKIVEAYQEIMRMQL